MNKYFEDVFEKEVKVDMIKAIEILRVVGGSLVEVFDFGEPFTQKVEKFICKKLMEIKDDYSKRGVKLCIVPVVSQYDKNVLRVGISVSE